MAGAVFSENQGTLTRGDGRKNEWSQKEIDDQLTTAFTARKTDVVAEFRQAFPRKKVRYFCGDAPKARDPPSALPSSPCSDVSSSTRRSRPRWRRS